MWEPFGNTTVLPPTQWHPEPQFRGTFSITASCLVTMSLCIWTSLHLNVPEHRKEHLQKYHKIGWMILGLLAPELVLWNAWEQRKKVKRLNAQMRNRGFMPREPKARERVCRWLNRTWQKVHALPSPKAEDSQELTNGISSGTHDDRLNVWTDDRLNAWTDVHSWLVIMGGMVFQDKSSDSRLFMPGIRRRCPITWEILAWMAKSRPHLVPDISREYIEDKSKSDWLAKGLTCWQAGYFCIQCTFRLSQQLSITLLELNVFAHAICTLLLFLVWWDKPRDVLVPTAISSEEALDICAEYLCSGNTVMDDKGTKHFIYLTPIHEHQSPDECFEIVQPTTVIVRGHPESETFRTLSDQAHHKFLKIRDTCWQWHHDSIPAFTTDRTELDVKGCCGSDNAVVFTGRDISLLERRYNYSTHPLASSEQTLRWGSVGFRKCKAPNWSLGEDQMELMVAFENPSAHVRTIAGVTFASACYGGLHLIAWTSAFPSHAALVMWRAASVTLLVTGPFCVAVAACLASVQWLSTTYLFRKVDLEVTTLAWVVVCLTGLVLTWYALCRTFIVVECFILLAHIPESALRVPTWATYIPSFG